MARKTVGRKWSMGAGITWRDKVLIDRACDDFFERRGMSLWHFEQLDARKWSARSGGRPIDADRARHLIKGIK